MPVVPRSMLLLAALLAIVWPACAANKCPNPAKPGKKDVPVGMSTYSAFPPLGTATAKDPIILCFAIPDPNNAKKTMIVEVPIPDKNGKDLVKWDPTKETAVQASARKAAAIKAAVMVAIAAGDLPGVTVDTKQIMVPVIVRNPNPPPPLIIQMVPGYTEVTYGGLTRQSVSVKTDPTKQNGGAINFVPGQPSPGSPGSTSGYGFRPTMCGPGSSMGSATGKDPGGMPSLVGFGFYDTGMPTAAPMIVGLTPMPGQTDAQIFGDLAKMFNASFESKGFHATYNPMTDKLYLDKPLPMNDSFWFGNSDTGLDLCEQMDPQPIFSSCPSFGMQSGGNILMAINDDGTITTKSTGQPPYDGYDDNLVCIQNLSPDPVSSLSLFSPDAIFGFDGDGICDFAQLPGCPFGGSGYEGPGMSFAASSPNAGGVSFPGGLAPGAGAYFALEAPFLGTAYLTPGNGEAAFTRPFMGPDNIVWSAPSMPKVGMQFSVQTQVLLSTAPVPNQMVMFLLVSGKGRFANPDPGSNGMMITTMTDDLGMAMVGLTLDAPGMAVVQASTPGGMLSTTLMLNAAAMVPQEHR